MNFKTASGAHIAIKELSDVVVDVFLGTGWYNWTRFAVKRVKGKVFLNKINGKPLKEIEFQELCQCLK